jgi:hypothetical protein
MIQIAVSTSHYELGTAKKVDLFVAVVARLKAKLKGGWSDGTSNFILLVWSFVSANDYFGLRYE